MTETEPVSPWSLRLVGDEHAPGARGIAPAKAGGLGILGRTGAGARCQEVS